MLNNNYDINKPKLKYEPDILNIGKDLYVSVAEYQKRGDSFFDIILHNKEKEIFIGRYSTDLHNINVMYNNGTILVYSRQFIKERNNNFIVKVHSLYDILDDVHYSLTEEEALTLFDPQLDTTFLKDKTKSTIREDVEKKHRLMK